MSTEIAVIKNTGREERDLDFTQFGGGTGRNGMDLGLMIQLTQGLAGAINKSGLNEPGFIHLTRTDAYKVVDELTNWLGQTSPGR